MYILRGFLFCYKRSEVHALYITFQKRVGIRLNNRKNVLGFIRFASVRNESQEWQEISSLKD